MMCWATSPSHAPWPLSVYWLLPESTVQTAFFSSNSSPLAPSASVKSTPVVSEESTRSWRSSSWLPRYNLFYILVCALYFETCDSTHAAPHLVRSQHGIPVCPHAGGVGLCELVQHLSMFDFVCVSGTMEGRLLHVSTFAPKLLCIVWI